MGEVGVGGSNSYEIGHRGFEGGSGYIEQGIFQTPLPHRPPQLPSGPTPFSLSFHLTLADKNG